MAKIDKVKETIGYLKVVFSIFIAIEVSIVGWLFNKGEVISDIKIIISVITIYLIALAIIIVNKKILKRIDELEDL